MTPTSRPCRGFSLIELLVVLVIVGILTAVGVTMIGNRPAGAVRSVMDELEGVIASAHKRAAATGQDIVITTTGNWAIPTVMSLTYSGAAPSEGFVLAHSEAADGTAIGILREHMHAGVVTVANAGWWASAATGNTNITGVPPFNDATSPFNGLLADNAMNLFQGGAGTHTARISGVNKRFTTSFWIEVVGLQDGIPIAGGPMGVMVVQANGATIYRFYNPGIINGGDGTWRKI